MVLIEVNNMEPSKEKALAVISHLGGLIPCFFLPMIIPFVVWITQGEKSAFVNLQSKEALNFQISLFIYWIVCWALFLTVIGIPIAFFAFIFFVATNLICSTIAAITTSRGQTYKYPINLRLIK